MLPVIGAAVVTRSRQTRRSLRGMTGYADAPRRWMVMQVVGPDHRSRRTRMTADWRRPTFGRTKNLPVCATCGLCSGQRVSRSASMVSMVPAWAAFDGPETRPATLALKRRNNPQRLHDRLPPEP
jgi:hypothetical protein